jgi:uridine phosphorylase
VTNIPKYPTKASLTSFTQPEAFIRSLNHGEAPPSPKKMILLFQKSFLVDEIEKVSTQKLHIKGLPKIDLIHPQLGVAGFYGIGAPGAVAFVEQLRCLGTKEFIVIGSAGSLKKEYVAGDILIIEKSLRDEGTSYHYLEPSRFAFSDSGLTQNLLIAVQAEAPPRAEIASSWTTDAPYRETAEEIQQYAQEGIGCVEMEASALFAVAQVYALKLALGVVVSDHLHGEAWTPQFTGGALKASYVGLFRAAYRVLSAETSESAL